MAKKTVIKQTLEQMILDYEALSHKPKTKVHLQKLMALEEAILNCMPDNLDGQQRQLGFTMQLCSQDKKSGHSDHPLAAIVFPKMWEQYRGQKNASH